MTWPMHDAGSTTPEPDPGEPELSERGAGLGLHAAADPLPPLDGPMPGGGPSPAETTLPLALEWPVPPAGTLRTPRFTPSGPPGSVDAPPGWRRVPRPDDYRPPDDLRPQYPQPGYRPLPGTPGGPGAPGGPGGSGGSGGPGGPGGVRPPRPPGQRATPPSSLVRSGVGMAVGTLVSRGTGFLRTLVLTYAIGTTFLGNAYNNPNTLPNTVYYLMLGGIFTAVVVPLLVRAAKRDPDRGEAYTQRMFTLGALALLVVTVLATALAGPLVTLTAPTIHGPAGSHGAAEHNLMVLWAYFFIPQIFFYGMSSLIGAILNTRGRFAAPMWAPVVNNLVVILIGGLYVVDLPPGPGTVEHPGRRRAAARDRHHPRRRRADRRAVPVVAGRRVPWRPTLGFRPGEVSEIGRMAGWMSVYVVTQSAANLVVQILGQRGLAPGRTGTPRTPSRGSSSSSRTRSSASR